MSTCHQKSSTKQSGRVQIQERHQATFRDPDNYSSFYVHLLSFQKFSRKQSGRVQIQERHQVAFQRRFVLCRFFSLPVEKQWHNVSLQQRWSHPVPGEVSGDPVCSFQREGTEHGAIKLRLPVRFFSIFAHVWEALFLWGCPRPGVSSGLWHDSNVFLSLILFTWHFWCNGSLDLEWFGDAVFRCPPEGQGDGSSSESGAYPHSEHSVFSGLRGSSSGSPSSSHSNSPKLGESSLSPPLRETEVAAPTPAKRNPRALFGHGLPPQVHGPAANETVPAFALHPTGVHYVPIVIHTKALHRHLSDNGALSAAGACHLISIPVNFGGPMINVQNSDITTTTAPNHHSSRIPAHRSNNTRVHQQQQHRGGNSSSSSSSSGSGMFCPVPGGSRHVRRRNSGKEMLPSPFGTHSSSSEDSYTHMYANNRHAFMQVGCHGMSNMPQ